jgi:predicted dehydrogenase
MQRIAILGGGYIGKMHAAAIKKSPRLELAALVGSGGESGKKTAAEFGCPFYTDVKDLLAREQVDILDVCLPTFLHESFVLLAAEYKKHVLCEKPLALSSGSAERMIQACETAGVKFMAAQIVRWMPEYVQIRKFLEQGITGAIHTVYCSRLAQHPNWTTWHRDRSKSGGGLFDLHLHDIDFLYSLFGKVDAVDAVGWKSPTGCWNHILSTLRFKNGVRAVAEGSMEMTGNFPFSTAFRVSGDNGTLDYKLSAGFNIENLESASSSFLVYEKDKPPRQVAIPGGDSFQAELEDFAAAVEEDRPVPIHPRDSAYVIRIIEALERSLETGTIAEVEASYEKSSGR